MGRTLLVVTGVLASAGPASAQTGVFEPGLDADPFVVTSDPASIALTESTDPLPHRALALGLFFRVGGAPLTICLENAGEPGCAVEGDIVSDRFATDLTAAFGLGRFGLHAQLPIVLYQSSDFGPEPGEDGLASAGVGDLRAGAKAWLWRGHGLTLGWDLTVSLPTSGGGSFLGSPGVTVENRGLATWRRGRLAAAASLGYAWRSHDALLANLYVNDEVVWSAGGEVAIRPATTVGLALHGRLGVMASGVGERPVELLLSGRHRLTDALAIEAGVGTGLDDGYGAPSYRVLAGLRWTRTPARRVPPPPPLPPPPPPPIEEPPPPPEEAPPPPPPEEDPPPPAVVELPPDDGGSTAVVTATRIEISDTIYFDSDKAKIKRSSHDILDAVAAVLIAYATLVVEIQGHTDDEGSDASNLDLSQRRAEAVRDYLVSRGVAADRLTAVGYGFGRPLVDGVTRKARSKNRRVEFVIVDAATGSPAR